MWAAAVSGGIWYSSDSGASWTLVDDWLPSLAVCCMAMDPANPDVMYAGTGGEKFIAGDAVGGAGIYKSTDGGVTWNLLPATADWDAVCRISVSPANSNVLLASRCYYGIFRSTDGGASWSNRHWAQGSFYVAFDPTDASKAIAQIIDWDWDLEEWYHAALYSTNGGVSWNVAGGLNHVTGFSSRIELAYAPSDTSIVYASCATDGGKIWRSTDRGHSYTLRTTSGSSACNAWANPLWVDPTNPNFLLTGGGHVFKSADGGATLTQISDGYILTEQVHPDIHYFAHESGYDATTNRRVYVCTDAGVHRTENIYTASTTSGWVNLQDSYRTVQFYGAAGDGPTGRLYGGTQDNGTLRIEPGSNDANLPFGGDGGFCAIDPIYPNYCYGEFINLQIHRSTDGGVSASYIWDGAYPISDAGSNANFIAPFILDPNNSNRMLAGGASLWRTNNVRGGSPPNWVAIRWAGSDLISAIAVAPGNSDVIWIAQNDGKVYRTTNGTSGSPTWLAVDDNGSADPLPNRYPTRILIDPDDEHLVYVSLGGFSADNLWKTDDNGSTWSDITGSGATGLPEAPIRGIARHPGRASWLYAGTEVGIFESRDGGSTWSADNAGPATVSVDELVFMHSSNRLLAATHGRGLFTALIPPPGDLNCDGVVDNFDVDPFVLAITDQTGYQAAYPGCDYMLADINDDGSVNNFDIEPFVDLLTGT